ncbi:MAG: hypothetical protein AAFU65_05310, partial [Pseudomonadota bacterium]
VQVDLYVVITQPQYPNGMVGGEYMITHSPDLVMVGWDQATVPGALWHDRLEVSQPGKMTGGFIVTFSSGGVSNPPFAPGTYLLGTLSMAPISDGELFVTLSDTSQFGSWYNGDPFNSVFLPGDTVTVKVY